jgi:hypothetical protein
VSLNCNGQLTHFQVRCFVHRVVYLVTLNSIDIKFCVNIYSSWNARVYFVRSGGPLVFVF